MFDFFVVDCCFLSPQALLEYEKHKVRTGQLKISVPAIPQPGGTNREVIILAVEF
jgi:hypothetical protein